MQRESEINKRKGVIEKRERERDITLVSEHQEQVQVNIAGRRTVCTNSGTTGKRLREVSSTVPGESREERERGGRGWNRTHA